MTLLLTQSHLEGLIRRHFAFLDSEPAIDHDRRGFLVTWPLGARKVELRCAEDTDFLETVVTERHPSDPLPAFVASCHRGSVWTSSGLEESFAEQGEDLSLFVRGLEETP